MRGFTDDILRSLNLEFCSHEAKPTHATSLLLWFSKPNMTCEKVAELGCGIGSVSIGLAKLYGVKVLGVDIERSFVECAKKNAKSNNIEKLVDFVNEDVSNIVNYRNLREKFDMVVFNPPHHFENRKNEKKLREIVRRASWDLFNDFLKATTFLLRNKGDFVCIISPRYLMEILELLSSFKLQPKEICIVHGSKCKNAELVLIRGKKNGGKSLKILPPVFLNESN